MANKHSIDAVNSLQAQEPQNPEQNAALQASLEERLAQDRKPTGFFHSNTWNYLIMLIAAAVGLFASLMLAADTLKLARNPNKALGCDVNSVLSCSTVAESWQAEIIKFGGLSFPNAFFGIAAYSVFITIAVIGLTGSKLPRWFNLCAWLGSIAALCYAYWLFTQSMFVIRALCPWCMTMMFATTFMFMSLSHATVTVQHIPRNAKRLNTYYRMRYDLMVDVVWILAVIALIFVNEGSAIFA
ncbi:vitamin K epoxide reductase family protein [Bifidobacterium sp. ESL0763]|uniref:vitamin K epoxide reductase family protein n=1 Tax=Bifidobacterium sp. ESL0763 TaxID=2983227 RepID=UPI0023F665FC|nr:vitamin K epoxide reductase family protein [Bifidobacterium sp. ESL0763]MDF7664206.1 vitamin K epoxide reductase family protein [Bifidobacterium sp. ESL0763]